MVSGHHRRDRDPPLVPLPLLLPAALPLPLAAILAPVAAEPVESVASEGSRLADDAEESKGANSEAEEAEVEVDVVVCCRG